uniref:Cytochrome b6-f complex subunit 6 n=1 Tax=Scherffelia dubia TaxID=3190 RepID=A0A142BYC3_SCHDU|nr:subunit VI of cytochrome b6/f complex [Scherffelia dubia]AMP43415.1 subunit VI of cytochrome b6/f complex [Scherffelia dubia]
MFTVTSYIGLLALVFISVLAVYLTLIKTKLI